MSDATFGNGNGLGQQVRSLLFLSLKAVLTESNKSLRNRPLHLNHGLTELSTFPIYFIFFYFQFVFLSFLLSEC